MKTPLRYLYNPSFFERLCPALHDCIPGFDRRDFIFRVFNNAWPEMEFKERVRHIANVLHHFLPHDFPLAAGRLHALSDALKDRDFPLQGIEYIFLADYAERYGAAYPEVAVALRHKLRSTVGAGFAREPLMHDRV